jgi:protein tyrosine/serine phosphatase
MSERSAASIPYRFAAGVLGVLCLAGAAGDAVPCANFGQVNAGLYRGAEPDDDCLEHLAALGIRTVVNLRDEKDASEDEQAGALALGMRYVNAPMSGFDRPSAAEVRRALAVIRASENQPVFVHCRRGRDRTGVVVAAYRVANDGWETGKALQEAKGFGLAWWQFGMRRFIRDLDSNADAVR